MNIIRKPSIGISFGALFYCYTGVSVEAWRACLTEEGGGVCPDLNHCCPISDAIGSSSCISEGEQPHNGTGVCCDRNGATGCGPDYSCSPDGFTCVLNNSTIEEKPNTLPRYNLCSVTDPSWRQIRSLSVEPESPQLAYYSTADVQYNPTVRIALIVIHGSGRNADDYLCCAVSSLPTNLRDSILVIAPIFLAPEDGTMPTPVPLLRWNDTDPIPHTWRYGADASNANISSYHAIDVLIEIMMDRIPSLQRVIVAGHSAGGQFTHRWALTSGSELWQKNDINSCCCCEPKIFLLFGRSSIS